MELNVEVGDELQLLENVLLAPFPFQFLLEVQLIKRNGEKPCVLLTYRLI